MVEQTVEERGGENGIGKDLVPGAVALVTGEDHRLECFVAFADHLEEGDVGASIMPLSDELKAPEVSLSTISQFRQGHTVRQARVCVKNA